MSGQHGRINGILHVWTVLCPDSESIKTQPCSSGCFNYWDLFRNTNVWVRVIPPSNHHQTTAEHELCSRTHIYSADDYVCQAAYPFALFFFFKGVEIFVHLKASFWFIVLDHFPSRWWLSVEATVGTGIKLPYPKQNLSSHRTKLHNDTGEVASF